MNRNAADRSAGARAERWSVVTGLVVVSALAWAYTIQMTVDMSPAGPGSGGAPAACCLPLAGTGTLQAAVLPHLANWGAAEFAMTWAMWAVMMAAMMLPTAIPMAVAFARIDRQSAGGSALLPVGAFSAGYLGAWALYSAAAALLQGGLLRAALLAPATLAAGPVLGGALLTAAGLYQWSRWKDACLKKCRNPLGFLLSHWRPGRFGALRLGGRYGLYCVGCCWLLMLLGFALGVMNLLWMALLTLLMLLEKVAPAGTVVSRAAGVGLIVWGGWMILA